MKKPDFKLKAWEKVLERERDHRQALLKEGQDYLLRVRSEARLTREAMQRAAAEFGQDPEQLQNASEYYQRQELALRRILELEKRVETVVSQLQAELLETRQNLKRLEILEERQLVEWANEEARVTQDAMDELSMIKFARQ
ncbi:flagellar FliJ family protein [bacterium]|nr:flagellar FliJ family protein [bacterium]